MKKEEKTLAIDSLMEKLANNNNFYLADTSTLTVEKINKLRRLCFDKSISLQVVKNSLLKKAMERSTQREYQPLIGTLKGATSIMFCESGSEPAKLLREFRKTNKERPILKGAFIEECVYIGDNQLEFLANIKSKNEMIAEVIALLQSPAKNVISALQSGKNKLAGIVKTLSERSE